MTKPSLRWGPFSVGAAVTIVIGVAVYVAAVHSAGHWWYWPVWVIGLAVVAILAASAVSALTATDRERR